MQDHEFYPVRELERRHVAGPDPELEQTERAAVGVSLQLAVADLACRVIPALRPRREVGVRLNVIESE